MTGVCFIALKCVHTWTLFYYHLYLIALDWGIIKIISSYWATPKMPSLVYDHGLNRSIPYESIKNLGYGNKSRLVLLCW